MLMIWLTAVKDLRRRLRDPWSLVFWVGIPLTLGLLLVTLFGRTGNVRPEGRLLVADLDGSVAATLLAGVFERGPMAELFEVEAVAEDEGQGRMDNGEAAALLVIPKGFGAAVLRGEPTTLRLVTNPSQRIMPGMAEGVLDVTADFVHYVRAYFPEAIDQVATGLDESAGASVLELVTGMSAVIEEFRPAVERLETEFDNPRLSLTTEVNESRRPALNIGELFFGSTLFMALFFTAQGLSEDYWREHDEGTLRRVASMPTPFWMLIAGKLVVVLLMGFLVTGIGLVAGAGLFGMRPASIAGALAWGMGSIALFYCLMSMLQLLASSRRMGGILSSTVMLPLLMLGGSFFPFEMMPAFMADIGRWTPNGWALSRYREVLAGTVGAGDFATSLLMLGVLCGAFAFLLQHLVRRRFVGV